MKAALTKRRQVVVRVWVHAHVRVFCRVEWFSVWQCSHLCWIRTQRAWARSVWLRGSHTGGNKSFNALQLSQHAGWRREALPEMCVLLEIYCWRVGRDPPRCYSPVCPHQFVWSKTPMVTCSFPSCLNSSNLLFVYFMPRW